MRTASRPQTLIFDADDTLWENNIYFEQAFDQFVGYLSHSSMSAAEVREALDEIEIVNREIHGYGALNFGRNLTQCFEKLVERDVCAGDRECVMEFARQILDQPLEMIEGVRETVAELAGRHELILFTKGHGEEQRMKIDQSGLGEFFRHTAIVKEKDTPAYRELVRECGIAPESAWMIGNSPRSDINPALDAGLGAVYIPHARTWMLEREEIRDGNGRLLILNTFPDLLQHF